MAKYKCGVCGFIYDEEKEDAPFSELTVCPVCRQPVRVFEREGEAEEKRNMRFLLWKRMLILWRILRSSTGRTIPVGIWRRSIKWQ